MKLVTFLLSLIIIAGCYRNPSDKDLQDISSASWVYESGFRIGDGDFIDFEKNGFYELKKDSVFKKGVFVGRIISYSPRKRQIKIDVTMNRISYYYSHDYR